MRIPKFLGYFERILKANAKGGDFIFGKKVAYVETDHSGKEFRPLVTTAPRKWKSSLSPLVFPFSFFPFSFSLSDRQVSRSVQQQVYKLRKLGGLLTETKTSAAALSAQSISPSY
ncbi:MAG TPA: glutathione S-transferase family protein [Candidatus Binatia bacterium]